MVQLHFQPARPGARARVARRNDLQGRHDGQRPPGRLVQTGRQGPYLVHGVRAHRSELHGTAVTETPAGRHSGGSGNEAGGFQAVAASPIWNRTKRRMVISSPNCLATDATCSLSEISEFFLTKP